MPLTPEDVRNKRFTPVRLREGYDMGEVDQFLDEVEAELERLTVENEELRAKVSAASSGEKTGVIPATSSPATTGSIPAVQSQPAAAKEPVAQSEPEPEPEPVEEQQEETAQHDTSVVEKAPAAEPEEAAQPTRRASMGDASSAAARLLEIASNNADQLMDAAKEEADRVVGEARVKAERLTTEASGKAERLETDSRVRAQKLDEETSERRKQALAAIERERFELQRDVEHLRAYEREYRARLKNYFQSQLDGLASQEKAAPEDAEVPAENEHKGSRSILGDDSSSI